jgi:RimJ/RimL family protein N-acetyltransferase
LPWATAAWSARSKQAAERLGFTFEGGLAEHDRQGPEQNRDTAWYSITDGQWPAMHTAFDACLADANQDPNGQLKSLSQ